MEKRKEFPAHVGTEEKRPLKGLGLYRNGSERNKWQGPLEIA
jgi:hypothetical protein